MPVLRLLFVLLFCSSSIFARNTANNKSFPDSVRNLVRLRSHLLVDPMALNPGQFDSLLQQQISFAFITSGEMTEKLKAMIARIPKNKLPVVVISEGKMPTSGDYYTDVIELTENDVDKISIRDNEEALKKKLSCKEFLWTIVDSDSVPSADSFTGLWEQSGKMPNFIQVKSHAIIESAGLISALNSHPKIFGVVRNGDQLLANVSWKDLPGRETNGYFSFPISLSGNLSLSPYKAGYQFSPDIVLPSPENLRNPKVFNAVQLDPDFGLTDQYSFSKRIRNLKRQNDDEIIPYSIGFIQDENHGISAFFSGKAYVDGGLKSRTALKPNFSMTGWIKPTELGDNNCILGKGKDFVLKIHNGMLTFTVQGIKDYFSPETKIPLNQWSFVGLVH
ncbi:hypothetical protein JZU61_02480, partial [bacterium]|nr:hypothetical protein [bacterium]